jgi:hypothetical protein
MAAPDVEPVVEVDVPPALPVAFVLPVPLEVLEDGDPVDVLLPVVEPVLDVPALDVPVVDGVPMPVEPPVPDVPVVVALVPADVPVPAVELVSAAKAMPATPSAEAMAPHIKVRRNDFMVSPPVGIAGSAERAPAGSPWHARTLPALSA